MTLKSGGGAAEQPARCSRRFSCLQIPTLHSPPGNTRSSVKEIAKRNAVKGGRTKLLQAKDRFLSVAHLWVARAIREGKSFQKPEAGSDASVDFQMFLAEAEILRHWGQTWRQPRAKSGPPLSPDVWRVPDGWESPARRSGWPKTGMIPRLTLSKELIAELK